jgi:HK97 family phage portal protein
MLRGNAYALKVPSRVQGFELWPLAPDQVTVLQLADRSIVYDWRAADGSMRRFARNEVFHLYSLTLDGVTGVSPVRHARETIGLSLAMERHATTQFRNGLNAGGYLSTDKELGPEGVENIRASLEAYRAGGERAGKWMILEQGVKAETLAMTHEDAQFIESRQMTRTDIAMLFGVPPYLLGDTEKSTSWGTGIEQQGRGFVDYGLNDDLVAWEETCNRDLLPGETDLYYRFNRAALTQGDVKTRWDAHVKGLQWGVISPNEVRALEDMNPRAGGDIFYPPPNTAGGPDMTVTENEGEGEGDDAAADS